VHEALSYEQKLAAQLRVQAYTGLATARHFGSSSRGIDAHDLYWVRDLEICSRVDVYVSIEP
jgi:hypothetical protein